MKRKIPLVSGEFYHIISRSIEKFKIFNNAQAFARFQSAIEFFNFNQKNILFAHFICRSFKTKKQIRDTYFTEDNQLAEIIAYCLMPTHIHLLLKQLQDNGISQMMGNALNSYSKYFNTKLGRTGPLWQGRFKNILVNSNEQLLHLTRYIHLNPVSAHLVEHSKDWKFSSYGEYVNPKQKNRICGFEKYIDMNGKEYEKFVMDRKDYQRELSKIKKSFNKSYTGQLTKM